MMKPPGMTSFDMVAWLRRVLNVKKAGHCGSLDPDAVGVLPVCIGAATGIAGLLTDSKKAYRVEAVAGLLTDTLDISGAILDRGKGKLPERSLFEAALQSFVGIYEQKPPMYSAVKIKGRKLYKLARKGIEIERPARAVTIYSLKTVHYAADRAIIDVICSKGTYIRTLCGDLGAALGIYLCVSFLLRTASAGLYISDACTVETVGALAQTGDVGNILIPADYMLLEYPRTDISDSHYARYMNGASVRLKTLPSEGAALQFTGSADSAESPVILTRVYHGDRFLGLGSISVDGNGMIDLRVRKLIIDSEWNKSGV